MPEREPLVLLHGFSGTPAVWGPIVDRLAEHHDLHMFTLAGHGGGVPLADGVECSVSALADALEADMDAAGLDTAHLCGNSLGGWLALELALRGRARSVVGLAPAGGWEPGSRAEKRLRSYFRRQYWMIRYGGPRAERMTRSPRMRRFALRELCVHGDRIPADQAAAIVRGAYDCVIWHELFAAIVRDGPPKAFDGISVPVRLVWGTRDRVLPHRRYVQRLRNLLPDAEYVEIEGVGHCPMADDPELISRTILEVTAAAQAAPTASYS